MNFPKNFLRGTATAAHQVEGSNISSDWWEAEQKGLVPYKSGKACDSYNRFEEDFDLAKQMNNNALRFSVEWARVEPIEGRFKESEIKHYEQVLKSLRKRNLEPFVTLHHFTLPAWFARIGGWSNPKAPKYFKRYVEYVARFLGKNAKFWITINEPLNLHSGYITKSKPPFHKNDYLGLYRSLKNMVEGHRLAYDILHNENSQVQVGIAKSSFYFTSETQGLFSFLNYPALKLRSYLMSMWFLDRIVNYQDFIGLNYYRHLKVSPFLSLNPVATEKKTDFGWGIYPKGLYYLIRQFYGRYKKPIYITENGISDADDDQRPDFIVENLKYVLKAINEGADVRGYFYWSLLDNFEWEYGTTQKFGLAEVNFDNFERKLRPSGKLYGQICQRDENIVV